MPNYPFQTSLLIQSFMSFDFDWNEMCHLFVNFISVLHIHTHWMLDCEHHSKFMAHTKTSKQLLKCLFYSTFSCSIIVHRPFASPKNKKKLSFGINFRILFKKNSKLFESKKWNQNWIISSIFGIRFLAKSVKIRCRQN